MKENLSLDELLVAYALKETNASQEEFVHAWLKQSAANETYYRQIQETIRLISNQKEAETIDINSEWKHLEETIEEKKGLVVNMAEAEIKYPIKEWPEPQSRSYKKLIAGLVAASLLLFFGWQWLSYNRAATPLTAGGSKQKGISNLPADDSETKIAEAVEKISLQDGSSVLLAKETQLNFSASFGKQKRDLVLNGEATFKVAKDQQKPFVVYTGDITTTAIGTEFTVSAYERSNTIRIRLYEGKVVVRSASESRKKLKEDYYLNPGQELIYNRQSSVAAIRNFEIRSEDKKEAATKDEEQSLPEDPSVPLNRKGSWYMFNNQSLSRIFDQLADMFEVNIIYNKKDGDSIYFIGSFEKSDPFEKIIKDIADVNGLKVVKQDGKYFISKR